MATLVTGVPGTGKTAFVVNELHTRLEKLKKARKDLPTIYQHGIRDLKIPHVQVWCHSDQCLACRDVPTAEKTLLVSNWYDYLNPGDILVVDECQRIWPTRGPSRPRPAGVAYMETHRHFGAEMYFLSQDPGLIDSDLRKHFRRHLHVAANWKGRKLYEWDTCNEKLQLTKARERPYKLPSSIFELYKSAEAHVEIDRKKPMSFYVAIGALSLAVVALTGIVWRNLAKNPSVTEQASTQQPGIIDTASKAISAVSPTGPQPFPDFKPEIEGVPESAPAYRPLLKVQSVPTLAGCVKSAASCVCYTHQATRYPTSREYCEETIKGNRFDPYAPPPQMAVTRSLEPPSHLESQPQPLATASNNFVQ